MVRAETYLFLAGLPLLLHSSFSSFSSLRLVTAKRICIQSHLNEEDIIY